MITVAELIEELQRLDPTMIAIVQKDGEGNAYSPLAGVDVGFYTAQNTWSGDVSEDEVPDSTSCIILFPVN